IAGGVFLNQLAAGLGTIVLLSATGWVLARAGGSIPPEIDGQDLDLVVEVRCPAGWTPSNRVKAGKNALTLASLNRSNVQTTKGSGTLDWRLARVEGAYTLIPGEVYLYNSDPKRVIDIELGEETQAAFLLPLPAKPGAPQKQWSDWLPRVADDNPVAKGF